MAKGNPAQKQTAKPAKAEQSDQKRRRLSPPARVGVSAEAAVSPPPPISGAVVVAERPAEKAPAAGVGAAEPPQGPPAGDGVVGGLQDLTPTPGGSWGGGGVGND